MRSVRFFVCCAPLAARYFARVRREICAFLQQVKSLCGGWLVAVFAGRFRTPIKIFLKKIKKFSKTCPFLRICVVIVSEKKILQTCAAPTPQLSGAGGARARMRANAYMEKWQDTQWAVSFLLYREPFHRRMVRKLTKIIVKQAILSYNNNRIRKAGGMWK